MVFSLVYISYAYTGWNASTYMAGGPQPGGPAASDPDRYRAGRGPLSRTEHRVRPAIPAAEVQRIATQNGFDAVAPIAKLAATRLFGPAVTTPFSIAVGLTLLASLRAYVLTGPRVAYAMAKAGHFPPVAGRLSARSNTPAAATAMQVAWALVLLWTGSFESIVIYASVGLCLFSMLSVSTIFVLRRTRPDLLDRSAPRDTRSLPPFSCWPCPC